MTNETSHWRQANYRYLQQQLVPIIRQLEKLVSGAKTDSDVETLPDKSPNLVPPAESPTEANNADESPDFQPAFERLCEVFLLTAFERYLLLLAIGCEIDIHVGALYAQVQGNPQAVCPTLTLAMRLFGKEANLQALTPEGALRHWQLVDINVTAPLLFNPFNVQAGILSYVLGEKTVDPLLTGVGEPMTDGFYAVSSQLSCLRQINHTWFHWPEAEPLILNFYSADLSNARNLATLFAANLGYPLYQLDLAALPQSSVELTTWSRLLLREAVLKKHRYYIVWEEPQNLKSQSASRLLRLIKSLDRLCFVVSAERLQTDSRAIVSMEAPKPTVAERLEIWRTWLPEVNSDILARLMEQHDLNFTQMLAVRQTLLTRMFEESSENASIEIIIKSLCREQSRKQLSGLVRLVEPKATLEDLIVSASQRLILRNIALQAAQRYKVYHEWGFANKSSRGLGISALFHGYSGTGKTLAAEALAHSLQTDLYHIDLSAVVSKYIGETEKHLNKVFDLAEGSGAILLFDEADALFGKRSEVKDSHDRYANLEVSYLLQRMESYSGLSILTTNIRSVLDSAFLRRIRFVVNFSMPNQAQRALIWQRAFPAQVPRDELDFDKLSRLGLSGAHIRNIALTAAFLAADANEAVNMRHLLRATQLEYQKMEKMLNSNDVKDWA